MNSMPVPAKPEVDERRKAMIAAAQHYDEVKREMDSLRDQLHTAVAGLEAKNSEIAELRRLMHAQQAQFENFSETQRAEHVRMLTEERSNVEIANKARDQAYAERSDALAWLSAIEAVIERAREGGDLQPAKKKRNGKEAAASPPAPPAISLGDIGVSGDVSGVPDQGGSAA